jgi:uncharacterized protein
MRWKSALDDALVPRSGAGKLAKTAVKRVGALGASIDLGDAPARRSLPATPELRLEALATRLAQAAGQPVLLMLDEIQAHGDVAGGEHQLDTCCVATSAPYRRCSGPRLSRLRYRWPPR